MNYDLEFGQQIKCSPDEKRQCMPLVSEIFSLANKARNYGLLSLGKEAEESLSFLLRKGLQLALDGVKTQEARTILEQYIYTGQYRGKDLLERCIILEGVLGIIEGMHPKILKELLASFFGEDGHEIYKEEYEDKEKNSLDKYLTEIANTPATTPAAAKLGNLIVKLNEKAIKQFLQGIDIVDLAKAMKEMDGKAQIKIFNNLPKRGAALLRDTLEGVRFFKNHEILKSQKKIVDTISELKEQGRI